ncbi:hypothetical protein LSH36_395g02065 [Paralvinella palmiformis]|uniref:Bardet-Biedl syndrome 1 n=1 Tax=Paralvinella palmiformis TaxID=53620 RepID=A0AAD9JD09_9ANNE|nr:hypothetical protein LSH36_395g02065 [Paralvinella palmiformis]
MSYNDRTHQPKGVKGNEKWLNAHYDPVASLYTFTQCITLSDINADGENKLVIADLGTGSYDMKLKVYKGTSLMTENTIIDLPTAVAVASGPYIYVYKNLRPYFKFTLPTLDVNPQEEELWNQYTMGSVNSSILREMLDDMRVNGVPLTTVITCLDTLKKCMSEEDAISCLVLGTESKQVYVLDPEAFTVLSTGKRLWSIKMPASIQTLETLDHQQKGLKAVMVALTNNEIRIYKEKFLVDIIITEDVVTGMRFGHGGLIIKILKRTAKFEEKDMIGGPPASQNQKLNVPKKTQLFVDQTLRERENAVSIHRQFQHDLYRIRLNTARNYVQGIGPVFKLTVNLQNTSLSVPSMDLFITFQFDTKLYALRKTLIKVPMLVPGLNYAFETFVECLSDKGISDMIKVFVLKKHRSIPIITAVINMPVSETMVIV